MSRAEPANSDLRISLIAVLGPTRIIKDGRAASEPFPPRQRALQRDGEKAAGTRSSISFSRSAARATYACFAVRTKSGSARRTKRSDGLRAGAQLAAPRSRQQCRPAALFRVLYASQDRNLWERFWQAERSVLTIVGPVWAAMSDAEQPIPELYREAAEQVRQLARQARLADIRSDLLKLAVRFERLAASNQPDQPPPKERE